ncbi:calcium-binding protein [Pseudomonas syringae group genomosp. 7]|uniref:calcium-binding protein n=1 Tax=Pseudomonas syringae group genomosp. 7 TaxID=251699 RepID=UPI000EFF0512|nr:calcium-binding protein [Pseudomonas syringae group genomosp. 7]RMR10291.1 putative Iron-regulated protein frpC [Pseudomonas syringae pv. helianthi]
MSNASNFEKATNVLQFVAMQTVKYTGVGGVFGQAATALVTGQIGATSSITDLLDKVDKGEATAGDVADVMLDIGAVVGGITALATGSTVVLTGVAALGLTKLLYENFPWLYQYYTEGQMERAIESGFNTSMPVEPGMEGLLEESLGTTDSFSKFIDSLKIKFGQALQTVSPLILDLDGNGVSTLGLSKGVHFDHDANGFREGTGWAGAGDALLVLDKNHNGLIDDGAELFGNQSVLGDGTKAGNGFEALKQLDSNRDGLFDSSDKMFTDVKVWEDLNFDGVSQSNEILSLDAVEISKIYLDYQSMATIDISGNQHLQAGTFARSDGTVAAIEDIWFVSNSADTIDAHPVPVSNYIAGMPDVKASGNVHSLRQTMQLDSTGKLLALVENFMNNPDLHQSGELIDDIMFAWAGVEAVDPLSRGGYLDARKVAVVEAFMGQSFVQGSGEYVGTFNPSLYSSKILSQIYDSLKEYAEASLNVNKSAYSDIIVQVGVVFEGGAASFDVSVAASALEAIYTTDPAVGKKFLEGFYNTLIAAGSGGTALVEAFKAYGNPTEVGFGFDLATANQWVSGTTDSNTLNDTVGNHVFDGRGGGDWVNATGGNDVFIYKPGYGYLEINNNYASGDYAILKFGPGVMASSLAVTTTESGNSLVITDGIDGDEIVLDYSLSLQDYGIKTILFDDGSTLSKQSLIALKDEWINTKIATGTFGNDTLTGTAAAQHFDGRGGQDIVTGNGGNDTFTYNPGYGYLEIINGYSVGETPVLQFGPGITAASLSVTTTESGNSLILNDGMSGDMIVLDYSLINQNYGVEVVRFDDGSTLPKQKLIALKDEWLNTKIATGTLGNDTLTGTAAAQHFDGKGGQDVITGNGGNDTFTYNPGYGYLEIINGYAAGDAPVLQFGPGITAGMLEVTATASGNSIILSDGIAGDMIVLDYSISQANYGVRLVQFSDGTSFVSEQLLALKDEWLNLTKYTGTAGNDTLSGDSSSQTIDGKGGVDVVYGNGGNDVFFFDRGYGYLEIINSYRDGDSPALKFGEGVAISSLSVTATGSGNSLILTDGTDGDMVVLDYSQIWTNYGVTSVSFLNGTSLSKEQIVALKDIQLGTSATDTLSGSAAAQAFDAKGGSDVIHGGGGSDLFKFNSGYGTLEIDAFFSGFEAPMLILGEGITQSNLVAQASQSGTDLILFTGGQGDSILLDRMLSDTGHGVKYVQFADGSAMTAAQLIDLAHLNPIQLIGATDSHSVA